MVSPAILRSNESVRATPKSPHRGAIVNFMALRIAASGPSLYTASMSPSDRTKKLDHLLERCEHLVEEGDLEEALPLALEARSLHPQSPDILCLVGGILGELGQAEEAIPAFEEALRLDKNHPEALGALADLLIYGGGDDPEMVERGLALCRRGMKVAKASDDAELLAELQLLEGIALSGLGAYAEALRSFEAAASLLADDPELVQERGIALFHLWRFEEAERDFRALLEEEPDAPWGLYHLGLLAERKGDHDEAQRLFARAHEVAPDEIPAGHRIPQEEFDAVVEEALLELPEKVRKYLSNVAIAVEDFPSEKEFQGDDVVSPTVLGVFRGSPYGEQGTFDPWSHFPNSILLFQRNLERWVSDREELVDEISITLLHEVGHFLGFDEDDLRERDLH